MFDIKRNGVIDIKTEQTYTRKRIYSIIYNQIVFMVSK